MEWGHIVQLVGVAVTVATFIGGIVIGYFHLALKTNLNEAKNEILAAVESKYVLTVMALQTEREIKRRIRSLERKVFGHSEPESEERNA